MTSFPIGFPTERAFCASTLGRDTAQCVWRRKYGFDVPFPPRTPQGTTDWSQGPDWSRLGSPYTQWWELSAVDEVSALRRQRWWWAVGGAVAGFAIGAVVYAKV